MGSQKKKVLWIVNIVLISIALLFTVFANELSDISIQLRGYTSYVYPNAGKEHILGPEKTVYYAVYYDGSGKAKYGEIIRLADNFVLEKVYPDGTFIEFTPPPLTEQQKKTFIDKYDPEKVKEKMMEQEKEKAKKIDKRCENLIERNLVKLTQGDNYIIYTYSKPDEEVLKHFSYYFEGVNHSNTIAKDYDFDVNDVKEKIEDILKKKDIPVPLKVSIVPYACTDFPQGEMQYSVSDRNSHYELHIILFNNEDVSMEEQFNIQFQRYLEEVWRE